MTRFYLKLVAPIWVVLVPLALIVRMLGGTQPPNPALRGFVEGCEGQPQPCWYGIVPGVTTGDTVKRILKRFDFPFTIAPPFDPGFSSQAYNMPGLLAIGIGFTNGIVSHITLAYTNDTTILIGDTMAQVGIPLAVGGKTGLRIVSFGSDWQQSYGWWSPFERTAVVQIYSSTSSPDSAVWHGFAPRWRYCQLEPNFADCPN